MEVKHNDCGVQPLPFLQLLGECVVRSTVTGVAGINYRIVNVNNADAEVVNNCDIAHVGYDALLRHVFDYDNGRLRITLINIT